VMLAVGRVIVLAFLVSVAYSQFAFDVSKNATLATPDEFNYRATTYGLWSAFVFNGAWFASFDAQVTPTQANVDAVWACAYVSTFAPPNSWLAHFEANVNYGNLLNAAQQGQQVNWAQVDLSASAGFIGQAYIKLVEVDASGAMVKETPLKNLLWTLDTTAGSAGATGGLYWVTYKGVPLINPSNMEVKLTIATSDKVGVMSEEWLNTVMTPKSLETFVKISNYPYATAGNKIQLVTAVVTADATLDASGKISAGSGTGKSYYNINAKSLVDGKQVDAIIAAFVSADFNATFENNDIVLQAQKALKGVATCYTTTITFPADAKVILLDPTIGSGSQPEVKSINSATSIFTSFVVAMFAVLVFIF